MNDCRIVSMDRCNSRCPGGMQVIRSGIAAVMAVFLVVPCGCYSAGHVSPGSVSLGTDRLLTDSLDDAVTDQPGLRDRLKRAGISIDADLVLEGFKNFMGGVSSSRTVGAYTLDVSLTADTEKLLGWSGGTLYLNIEDHGGKNPSDVLVGDLQVFDKLNTPSYTQIFELWYQQMFLKDKLRVKVGKIDGNLEFSVIDNGLTFLNSSAQVTPTCFLLPTTPDPMPGLVAFVTPHESYYAGFGVFYSNRSERFGDIRGDPQLAQLSEFGAFLIGETGVKWGRSTWFEHEGNVKLGAWAHTGTFATFDGAEQEGTHGYYVALDQTLWQPSHARKNGPGLRTFLGYGQTQKNINAVDYHVGGGVTWTGLQPDRPDDVIGIGPQYAHISEKAGLRESYELAVEAFYRMHLNDWATVQPDLQYIVNPGGQYPDALVLTVHADMHF